MDTFFMISGMLVTIGFFEQASKGKVNWFLFYFYRYIRITTPLAIVILWYAESKSFVGKVVGLL